MWYSLLPAGLGYKLILVIDFLFQKEKLLCHSCIDHQLKKNVSNHKRKVFYLEKKDLLDRSTYL